MFFLASPSTLWDFWPELDMSWVSDLTGSLWQGVVNMIASFAPFLALIIGLTLAFLVIGKLIDLVLRRKEGEDTWW